MRVSVARHAFLSGWDALFILLGLHFAEVLVGAVLHDFRGLLGLDESARSALTLLLASAVVFTLAMRFTRTRYGEMFHASTSSSPAATAALLIVPVVALVPALVLLGAGLTEWLVRIAPLSGWELEMLEQLADDSPAALVLVCVLAPVLEEMLFRGLILRGFLARYPRWPAILGSALLFGAAHLNLYQFVVCSLGGVLLGWLYERTRSLIPCIALHAAYNAAVTWAEWQHAKAPADLWWDGSLPAWALALGLAGVAGLALARMLRPRAGVTDFLAAAPAAPYSAFDPNEEGPCP
jgi:membrane protease YdiL (CAAX protease family)